MQTHKNLARDGKSGKAFAIMNSEQAQPRVCWINKPVQRERAGALGQGDRGGGGPVGPCRRVQRRPSALARFPRRAPAMGRSIYPTHPRCGKEKAGDTFTSLSVMNRRHAGLSRQNVTLFRPDPIF